MKERDIRPENYFYEFLELAKKDCIGFFRDAEFVHVVCPACGADEPRFQFEKSTFTYHLCRACETLYVTPRPSLQALSRYYTEAPSSRFWVDIYEKTVEMRRQEIFVPRAALIHEIGKRHLGDYRYVYDIGGGHGIMSEELRKLHPKGLFTVIEPSPGLSDMCREKGLFVIQKLMEEVKPEELPRDRDGKLIAMSFEILEHLFDPLVFLQSVRNILRRDDLFVFTALNNFGFDLSTLWEVSDTVSPPQHLTIFNLDSLRIVVERAGFEIIEMTTPGRLDVELVKKKITYVKDRFIIRLMREIDASGEEMLQDFLSRYRLSSFVMGATRAC